MSENVESAVMRATRGPIIKEYADGSLAVRIVIAPADKQSFMQSFPVVYLPIFIARETKDSAKQSLIDTTRKKGEYGEFARDLRLHTDWMRNPTVWKVIGTDAEYLEWCRDQKCAFCNLAPHWKMNDLIRSEPAHVRRIANGAGEALKPPYSAIPLCGAHHRLQHQAGESMFDKGGSPEAGKDWFDKQRIRHVELWLWQRMHKHFDVGSMTEVEPKVLFDFAVKCGIDRFLPTSYRQAR